jgi:peptidoglycan/xylan/chitin deacetylase (PgdA/CDA1 family)
VVSLDDGLALAASDQSLESSVVAVTFDDGTADFADLAVPVLVRFSIPVTLYVATSFIDAGTDFPDGGRPVSWAGLRDARSTGLVEIGSHTHHHALLDRLPTHAVGSELDDSIESIRRNLGVAPRHFAYPKAILGSPEAEQEVRARFVSAALAGTRPNRLGATDAHRLARSPIQINDGMRWFMKKVRGGLGMEDALRRRAARYRYRGRET